MVKKVSDLKFNKKKSKWHLIHVSLMNDKYMNV